MHKLTIAISCVVSLLLVGGCTAANKQAVESESQTEGRPNIIFMMTDDHAYQAISAYGSVLNKTPNKMAQFTGCLRKS